MKIPNTCACIFCQEFVDPPKSPNRILWEGDKFVLLPSIGSITPGYVLLMPRQHVRSFADLSSVELSTALDIAEQVRSIVSRRFGPTILAEHGPGQPGTRSAACCDHAHWHLIPCDPHQVSQVYDQTAGIPTSININELCQWKDQAYIFLSPLKHVYWVWPCSENTPSQFVRRVCANILKLEDYYDWGVFPFTENMIVTRSELGSPFHSGIVLKNVFSKSNDPQSAF